MEPTVLSVTYPIGKLQTAEPMPAFGRPPGVRPALLFLPTPEALRALAAADTVLARDVADPSKTLVVKGHQSIRRADAEGRPDGEPITCVVVELDLDSDEADWLRACCISAKQLFHEAPEKKA